MNRTFESFPFSIECLLYSSIDLSFVFSIFKRNVNAYYETILYMCCDYDIHKGPVCEFIPYDCTDMLKLSLDVI